MRTWVLLFLFSLVLFGQDRPARIVVDVPLVSLDVRVTDGAGLPINMLSREDFLLYEDGVLQQIQTFSSVEVPYNVLLLFDCSGSTRPQMELLTAALKQLTSSLRPQDVIAIAQFGLGVDLLVDWREKGAGSLDVQLGTYSGCNDTNFYSALVWAAQKMSGIEGRKGIVVYTDGAARMPTRSMVVGARRVSRPADAADDPGFRAVLEAVRASAAAVYFVAIDTDLNPPSGTPVTAIYAMQQARARMEQLADISGGRVVFPKSEQDVLPLYERIGREMGTAYSLGYVSSNLSAEPGFRSIVVRVRGGVGNVRQSRDGYVPSR